MNKLVLSLFPGIDVLGRGFEEEGWTVVRGPDLLWGGDVRRFHAQEFFFAGVIAGPPCQDFSSARRAVPTGRGDELLAELVRIIGEAAPHWWLMENVPRCHDVRIEGYSHQRIDVAASDFGLPQRRLRHFQFGHGKGFALCLDRPKQRRVTQPAAMASEGERSVTRRGWSEFCALQGLPPIELPGLTLSARYLAVGNAVALPVARAFARAIYRLETWFDGDKVCACGCARPVTGRRVLATGACRQRELRRRRAGHPTSASVLRGVTGNEREVMNAEGQAN